MTLEQKARAAFEAFRAHIRGEDIGDRHGYGPGQWDRLPTKMREAWIKAVQATL